MTSLNRRGLLPRAVLGWVVLIGVGSGMAPLVAGELSTEGSDPRLVVQTQDRPATAAPLSLPDARQALRKAKLRQTYGELPLSFEPNRGQAGNQVRFLSRGPGYSYLLLDRELVFQFQSGEFSRGSKLPGVISGMSTLRMRLVNGRPRPGIRGQNRLRSKSHYLRGTDPRQWHTDVPTFSKVRYQQVYPGIDLIFYGNGRRLEFDFRLDSGADPGAIRLHFAGGGDIPGRPGLSLDEQGNLILPGDLRLMRPLAFQEVGGVRREVRVQYELGRNGEVGFRLGRYDPGRPLVIDPVLTYSANGIGGFAVAVDRQGNAYVTGIANPAFLTSSGAFQSLHSEGECYDGPNLVRCPDILLAKLNAEGTELVYSTFLGGSGFDYGYGVAVDAHGNAYLTGTTSSSDYPVSSDAWQSALSSEQCGSDLAAQFCNSAFVTKVNADGTALLYSTYLGGNEGGLGGNGIAVDVHGSAYVTGDGAEGGFVAKVAPDGTSLLYSVQGVGGAGVALDSQNNAYLSGRSGNESFVTKLDSEGAETLYSFRLGGTSAPLDASPQELEGITGIAVDARDFVYVTGYTAYQDFPTTAGAYSESAPGAGICGTSLCLDAFVSKLNREGTALVYSTYLGGSSIDYANGVGVDLHGNAYVTGVTLSSDFPEVQALGSSEGQIFVSKLDPQGEELVYSVRAGSGDSVEGGSGLWVSPRGSAYITGQAGSDFTLTTGAYQASEGNAAFVARLLGDAEVFVPIVLATTESDGAAVNSELTLSNRGTQPATLEFTYTAAIGGGSGTATDDLPAGRQRILPDAIDYLRELGVPIPDAGSRGGSLSVRFSGLNSESEGTVGVRTARTVDGVRSGWSYPGVSTGFHQPVYLCGLRHDDEDRSSLVVHNLGSQESGDITLRLTIVSGDPQQPDSLVPEDQTLNSDSLVLEDQTIEPGSFSEIEDVLRSNGLSLENGYVRVEKVEGQAPYYAYALLTDRGGSDGSFIAPVPEKATVGRKGQTLLAVEKTARFNSELVVTNWSESRMVVGFSVLSDGIQNPLGSRLLSLRPREQFIVPEFVSWLRNEGGGLPSYFPGLGAPGDYFSGSIFVTVAVDGTGEDSGYYVGVRNSTLMDGRRNGFVHAAVPYGDSHHTPAWVYGLRQDQEKQTDLGIVNTGELSDETSLFSVEIYDGETGMLVHTIEEVELEARKSIRLESILEQNVPETDQGYVRVSRISGSNPFLTFAVVTDGIQDSRSSGDAFFIYGVP
ncbi:MAG: SBBP repeat-containing protein [Acidobacteriota bacterium]|nr:SBBP repeat-containing protein [Acidobacteriota bacterium]